MIINKEIEYQTKNSYEIKYEPLKDRIDVSHFIDGEDLYLVSYEDKKMVTGGFKSSSVVKEESIVTKESLDKIISSPNLYHEILRDKSLDNLVYLIEKDMLKKIGKYGVNFQFADFFGEKKKSSEGFMKEEVYSNQDSKFDYTQMIKFDNGLVVFTNSKGDLFGEPQMFNYISGGVHNGQYHLDNLVEYLMKRDDIVFIKDSQGTMYSKKSKVLQCPLVGDEPGIDGIIDDIPSYNADDESNETICFLYCPKQSDIKKLIEWSKDNSEVSSLDLDSYILDKILNTSQFKKQPVKNDKYETPKRKFKR